MQFISLQSGSNGNCIYVEACGVKLLFDAGISGSLVQKRLALHGRDANSVDAVLISHDHIDHCRHAGVLSWEFGLPVNCLKTPRSSRPWRRRTIDLETAHEGNARRPTQIFRFLLGFRRSRLEREATAAGHIH